MEMQSPPHVGEVIRHDVLEPLGLNVTEAARVLGVTRTALSSLLNGRAALSPEMAIRLEKAFGPKMEHLMRMQHAYDIAQARAKADQIQVERYVPRRAPMPA
jgi:addiction module HigA family antidote